MGKNPFISTTEDGREYLTAVCSLNKVRLAKLPLYGIEDSMEGKRMSELFGANIIIDEIVSSAAALGIEPSEYKRMDLPKVLDVKLAEGNEEAKRIARLFGGRLGMFFLVLKTGLAENRAAREDWTEEHWSYWANVGTVYLAGGLAGGLLGEYMLHVVSEMFDRAGVPRYNIVRNTNSSEMGAKGCLSLLEDKEDVHILFDFGQTKIKRMIAVHRSACDGKETEDETLDQTSAGDLFDREYTLIDLPSHKSIDMEWYVDDEDERRRQAEELHAYIVESIIDTYQEALKYGTIRWEIIISMASYVIDGIVNDARSGYAKLFVLSDNYAGYLAKALEERLGRTINIRLVHDGTAAALYYKGAENAVCITAGTALGVGFPEIKIR